MPAAERQILSVSQLNRMARQLLETHLSLVWIEGEISNLARPASGHCYFTLKDSGAQIRCAMFKNRSQYLRIKPDNGMKVLIRGRISLYEGRGDYQLIVEHMEDAGLGALQRAYEELREKLASEGLFATARKRPLPSPAKHIAIITSASGAALHDILSVFMRRWPGQPLTLVPTPVQGAGAANQIIQAIARANRAQLFDVILLARGGGSLEDLWCFNDEGLARAIVASEIPIITGVGHESDTTIADFAADARAPTPSAAAEILSPSADEWFARCSSLKSRLDKAALRTLTQTKQRVDHISHRLTRCEPKLESFAQTLDRHEARLQLIAQQQIAESRRRLKHAEELLNRLHPSRQLDQGKLRLANATKRLLNASPSKQIPIQQRILQNFHRQVVRLTLQRIQRFQFKLANTSQNLNNLSPLQTLQRGFALATNEQNTLLRDANDVTVGDTIHVTLDRGQLTARVVSVAGQKES
ncbi:exodeoxyribonuclease VII large subunit [Simiduia aestuariiviva]|uniref:Exodeoxyribonuclease 7 large subunit n=1 Tax=Simiduia aestuariiviva TaxID=1510459 RepID=A0A839UMJ0_9GAMM|nr:exodeoxyribonuclease VII large subunit [Simiduia aestuariiviva]MBB3167981.1 exodeoxyribonuclease VII large subunit [Simiduia aestuariiviva]